jgi:F-type H+-transporting ATPase subunit a
VFSIASDPMHQFKLSTLVPFQVGGMQLDFTNSSLFMAVAVLLTIGLIAMGMSKAALVPGRFQSVIEMWHGLVAGIIRNIIGEEGMRFFPLVFTVFSFILMCNLLGMVPYFFTVTSHISVTLALGVLVFTIVVVTGIATKGVGGFLGMFAPSGLPWAIYPLLVPIEIISFLIRPFTLGVRLFANMLAGHSMLKVLAGFIPQLITWSAVFGGAVGLLTLMGIVAVTGLEFLVAFLQAYVFAILTCIYLNDMVHDNHH